MVFSMIFKIKISIGENNRFPLQKFDLFFNSIKSVKICVKDEYKNLNY